MYDELNALVEKCRAEAEKADDLRAIVDELRSRAMVAGQCSAEGPEDAIALMAGAEADYLTWIADRLAAIAKAEGK